MLSNLPDGCTNKMIEDQCGDEESHAMEIADKVERAVRGWCGYDTHELIADILEATEEDFADVLAKARGELEMRQHKKRRAK